MHELKQKLIYVPVYILIIVTKGRKLKELITRIIVAAIGIPLAILLFHTGGYVFFTVIAIISSLGLLEFYNLAHKNNFYPRKTEGVISGILLLSLFFFLKFSNTFFWLFALLVIFIIIIMIVEMFTNKPNSMGNIASTIMGILYVSLAFASILGIRQFFEIQSIITQIQNPFTASTGKAIVPPMNSSACGWLVLSVFVSVWICDSSAYFVGKSIGKHKLFPRVSPKKSWEGAVGGFFGAIIGFYFATFFLIPELPALFPIVGGIIVGTVGQIGDLAESLLKREAGVKDSSSLIPGHGGILDRFDSVIFAMPVFFVFLVLSVIFAF